MVVGSVEIYYDCFIIAITSNIKEVPVRDLLDASTRGDLEAILSAV